MQVIPRSSRILKWRVKRVSMIVYIGSMSAIHGHWTHRMQSLNRNQRSASRVIVPGERLSGLLQARVPDAPELMPVDHWLGHVLPQHITRAPRGTWEFLTALVPDTLFPPPWRDTPGVAQSLAQLVDRGRKIGMRTLLGSAMDRLPWPALWTWYDRHVGGTVADELRMYEYAARSPKVPNQPGGFTFIYGFTQVTPPLWKLLGHWASRTTVEMWAVLETMEAEDRDRLASLGVEVRRLDGPSGATAVRTVRPDPGLDVFDQSATLLLKQDIPLHETVFVSASPASGRALARALKRHALVPEAAVLEDRGQALWRLFLLTARDRVREPIVARWLLESTREAGWARDWWRRAMAVPSWSALLPLIEEAADVHQTAWPEAVAWAGGMQAWDAMLLRPSPERVEAGLDAVMSLRTAPAWLPILPLDEAIWLPASHMVVVTDGSGGLPRPRPRTPFDSEDAISTWIRRAHPERHDAILLQHMVHDPGLALWWVGSVHDGFSHDSDDHLDFSTQWDLHRDADPERIRAWYREWREEPRYSHYTGQVDPAVAGPLMPARLSPSALEDFGRCPLSFFLGRLLRVPVVDEDTAEVGPQLAGQWAHRAMQLMVECRWDLSPSQVRLAVKEAMAENPAPSQVAAFYLRYQEDRLASELYEALLRDGWSPAIRSEAEVDFQWELLWPMSGRVDRLDWLDGNMLRLVDYKTGKLQSPVPPTPSNLQLLLYQDAVSRRYQRPVAAELYGISQRSKFQHRRLEAGEADLHHDDVQEILTGIQERMDNGAFFPVPDARLQPCRMCSFQLVCPARVPEYAEVKIAAHPAYQRLWRPDGEKGDMDDNH